MWGISGLESADPCSISSGDCERVLPYLNKLVSSLVSSTADFILDEEDDVSGTEDGYTLRQIRRWFAKEPPSTEQLDYRRTRLKQELSPPPIEEIKLPDRVEKYKPARPEVVLIISTAIFAVIFAFLYRESLPPSPLPPFLQHHVNLRKLALIIVSPSSCRYRRNRILQCLPKWSHWT